MSKELLKRHKMGSRSYTLTIFILLLVTACTAEIEQPDLPTATLPGLLVAEEPVEPEARLDEPVVVEQFTVSPVPTAILTLRHG